MGFGESNHLLDTFGEKHVVGSDWLAILACWRNRAERHVVVRYDRKEGRVALDANSWITRCILSSDLECCISAAIVDYRVVPVPVCLGQHALDALSQEAGSVVDRSDYTDVWILGGHECSRTSTLFSHTSCQNGYIPLGQNNFLWL